MKMQETVAYNNKDAPLKEKESVAKEIPCSNCGQELQHNFCSRCGQRKYRRINRNYIIQELQNVFSATGGFLYTLIKLIRNPGKTARKFIDGQRVNHFRPLYFVFILSGFDALIGYQWVGIGKITEAYYAQQNMGSPIMHDIFTTISSNHSLLMLLLLPVFALCTKLAFCKWGQNYYEHIVMNAYILSIVTLIGWILIYPIMYFVRDQIDLAYHIIVFGNLIVPFVLVWFFKGFYPNRSLKSILVRVLSIMGLIIIIYLIFIILGIILGFVYAVINGPEALEYIQPK